MIFREISGKFCRGIFAKHPPIQVGFSPTSLGLVRYIQMFIFLNDFIGFQVGLDSLASDLQGFLPYLLRLFFMTYMPSKCRIGPTCSITDHQ